MINRRNFLRRAAVFVGAGWTNMAFGVGTRPAALPRLDPPDNADWDWWRNLPRHPIRASEDPLTNKLCHAAATRHQVTILYDGGTEPDAPRRIAPLGVFEVEGYRGAYVLAFCFKRRAERTFRLDRIVSLA